MIKLNTNKKFAYIDELKWILLYIKKYWKAIFLYSVMGMFSTFLSLVGSLMSKTLIDAVTGYETGRIFQISAFMVFFGCSGIIFNGISKKVSAYYNVIVQNDIQSDIYNSVIETDWEALNEFSSGDLLNRVNGDVSIISSSVIGWIPNLLIKALQFLGSLAIIMYYDTIMAAITLVSVPLSVIVSRIILNAMKTYNDKLREASSELMSFQEDSFQNIQSIKAFNVVNYFENEMITVQEKYKNLALKFNTLSVIATSFMSFVAMVISYACLGWGVYQLWNGEIAFGTLTLFLQLAANLNGSFSALMALVPQAISTLTSTGRVLNIVSLPKEEYTNVEYSSFLHPSSRMNIMIDGVSFRYMNKANTLSNVSLQAKSGEIIGIVGSTGAGKTTLVRLLLGLIKPDKGSIFISNGKETIKLSESTRELFSYVPQDNTLFAGTIKDNLLFGVTDKSDEEIIEALKMACAWEFVNALPGGIMSIVKERGKGFSQGQAQRLAIARALLKDSPILLLDEATSALDIDTEQKIINNIYAIKNNRIYFVVSHRPSIFKYCTRIYKIQNATISDITNKNADTISINREVN